MIDELLSAKATWGMVVGLIGVILFIWILLPNKQSDFLIPEVDFTPVLPWIPNSEEKVCTTDSTCRRFESKGEKICRQTLENHFKLPFVSVRPDWLKNKETGRNLELDCYNEDLKLAVEYNGIQHYRWPNFTKQTYESFLQQRERDAMKSERCKELGINLIVVPYTIDHHLIPAYILSKLPLK